MASSLTELGDRTESSEPLARPGNPVDTEIDIIRSVPILQKTIEHLDLTDEAGKPLRRLQLLKNLRLANDVGPDLLTISYRDPDPEQAKAVVDTLIESYLEENLRSSRAEVAAARSFLSGQLPAAEVRVHELELELRQFKERHQVVSIEEEGRSAITALADLQRHIGETQSELAAVKAESAEFSRQLGMTVQQATALTTLSQSEGVQEVLSELQGVESQLVSERVRFQDGHPVVRALLDKKANLETLLNQRIAQTLEKQQPIPTGPLQSGEFRSGIAGEFVRTEVRRAGLENQVSKLASLEQIYQQRINVLPKIEQELRELERKSNAAQATYSLLLQRFQEAQVVEHQNIGNAHVIQPAALLEDPVAPNILLNLAVGGILGTLLAITTALLLEAQDQSIRSVQEAKHLFGDILLGIIPLHQQGKRSRSFGNDSEQLSPEMIVHHASDSPTGEAYRMLQANLRSLCAEKRLKIILVTSSIPKEGKSTIAANLALALAQSGRRVLLIDADLRCPRQHKLWQIPNEVGLNQVLTEQNPRETAIQSLQQLDVLTAGPSTHHRTRLLDSERMTEVLQACAASYDFVIVDTPAWNVAADVAILSPKADGMLFVVRPGVVDPVSAAFAKESLKQANQNILGLVINGVTPAFDPYYFDHRYSSKQDNLDERASAPSPAVPQTNGSQIGV